MSGTRDEAVITALQLADAEGITLEDIAELAGYPAASCSAAIRALRTPDGGNFPIESIPQRGGWRYRFSKATPCLT